MLELLTKSVFLYKHDHSRLYIVLSDYSRNLKRSLQVTVLYFDHYSTPNRLEQIENRAFTQFCEFTRKISNNNNAAQGCDLKKLIRNQNSVMSNHENSCSIGKESSESCSRNSRNDRKSRMTSKCRENGMTSDDPEMQFLIFRIFNNQKRLLSVHICHSSSSITSY